MLTDTRYAILFIVFRTFIQILETEALLLKTTDDLTNLQKRIKLTQTSTKLEHHVPNRIEGNKLGNMVLWKPYAWT